LFVCFLCPNLCAHVNTSFVVFARLRAPVAQDGLACTITVDDASEERRGVGGRVHVAHPVDP
jgi:hypothetical protein